MKKQLNNKNIQKHIIIEGPNNVGKSYLIQKLKENCKDYEIEHLSNYCPNTYSFHKDLLNYNKPMLFDRFCIGETIYPKIFNRASKMTFSEVIKLLKEYSDKIILIFVDADYDFIIRAYNNKYETFDYDFVKYEKELFYDAYQKLLKVDNLLVYRFKNHVENKNNYDEFIKQIISEVNNEI